MDYGKWYTIILFYVLPAVSSAVFTLFLRWMVHEFMVSCTTRINPDLSV